MSQTASAFKSLATLLVGVRPQKSRWVFLGSALLWGLLFLFADSVPAWPFWLPLILPLAHFYKPTVLGWGANLLCYGLALYAVVYFAWLQLQDCCGPDHGGYFLGWHVFWIEAAVAVMLLALVVFMVLHYPKARRNAT